MNGNMKASERLQRYSVFADITVNAPSESEAVLIVSRVLRQGDDGNIATTTKEERNLTDNIRKAVHKGQAKFVHADEE